MDALLQKVTQQAMSYAIRSGIAITSHYALKQCGRLMKTVDGQEKQEIARLQQKLDSKIKIISPAIDMIELIAARGNTTLESAVTLTKSLRWEIQTLGSRVEKAVTEEQLAKRGSSKAKSQEQNRVELKIIIEEMKRLLDRIEDSVPFITLAINTSGVNLSTTLPPTVSPSRLLQASTFLTSGDMQYCATRPRAQQIGPTFTLSMYMLFAGHANRPHEEDMRETTWKEVMHKARVTLMRVPLDHVYDYPTPFGQDSHRADEANHDHIPSDNLMQEFAYQLLIVEDLDDGRMHEFEESEPQPGPYDGVEQAGVREIISIHEVSKIFYADTGKILNIGADGESNNPILLLKRDVHATPPRRMMEQDAEPTGYESDDSHTIGEDDIDPEQSELEEQLRRESTPNLERSVLDTPTPELDPEPVYSHPWRLPATLDLEWMAFEVYTEDPTSDSDLSETEEDLEPTTLSPSPTTTTSPNPSLLTRFSTLNLRPSTPTTPSSPQTTPTNQIQPTPHALHHPPAPAAPTTLPAIKTSLSLLEMLIRLTALQQFQQSSHLAISDEFLNFFLSDSSSTVGAGGDAELRRRVRREARMRVGFDPYDESPIKRRGEQYLEHELHESHHDSHYDAGGEQRYDRSSPGVVEGSSRFEYDTYPLGRAASSASSPYYRDGGNTPSYTSSTPRSGSRSRPGMYATHGNNVSSPSPLLRRATTQPARGLGFKQPSFARMERGSEPDTPPSTVGR
ncbi:Periplasmic protein TonB [Pyrenophora tritici-repentis]|uniref:Periplasmic protein TonB n=1 Tax=Pyrenophora tritici-repentis TaxID=45151 RepID=A0A316ZSA4_9PLEO|nr:Periplasmic protein TonB [Pyrenophora tritici-repentis]